MQCNSKLCYIFIFLRQYSKIIYFISEIVTVTGLLDLLDSQDFYKHVMQERGLKKYGMKTIVETLANDDLKCFYGMNRHSALGDAETLCLLSHSKSLGARFSSWVVGFQSLVGPSPIPMVKRRTQSVQRFIPG